jgi:hypothetical protein
MSSWLAKLPLVKTPAYAKNCGPFQILAEGRKVGRMVREFRGCNYLHMAGETFSRGAGP